MSPTLKPYQAKNSRGMLVIFPPKGRKKQIKFQYNPAEFAVKLDANLYSSESPNQPLVGAPKQNLDLKISIEATTMDAKERKKAGIRPQLAQLEMLLYPDLENVKTNKDNLNAGKIEAVPAEPPGVLLVFGNRPAMPVRIKGMTVTERLHDGALNPIVADVSLSLEVVTYSQVPPSDKDFGKFLTYHQRLEKAAGKAKS